MANSWSLLSSLNPFKWMVSTKAQTNTEAYRHASIQYLEGAGMRGAKSRPFNYDAAIALYRSWVYAAATINSYAVASTPLRLYQRKSKSGYTKGYRTVPVDARTKRYLLGKRTDRRTPWDGVVTKIMEWGDDFEQVTEPHPAITLLSKPNQFTTGFEMAVLRTLFGELTGNAYLHPIVYRNGPMAGLPRELWTMPSQWTQIIPSRENFIDGYLYGKSMTDAYKFEPDEVIHFKRPNPGNLYYGLGKVEAGWSAVSLANSSAAENLAFADNMSRPDYAVIVEGNTNGNAPTQDQVDKVVSKFNQKLRGTRRSGNFIAISGKTNVVPLNFPPKEYGTPTKIVEEIAAVFQVPVTKLLASDPNRANAETGDTAWLRDSIHPLLRLDEEVLNLKYLPLWDVGEDAFLAYDNPVPENDRDQLEEDKILVSIGGKTVNELRESRGMEPVEGGDIALIPSNLQRLDKLASDETEEVDAEQGKEQKDDDSIDVDPVKKPEIDEKSLQKLIRRSVAKAVKGELSSLIKPVESKIVTTKAVDPLKSEPGGVPPDVDVLRTAMANYFKDEKERYQSDPTWFTDEEKKKDRDRSLIVLLLLFLTPWAMQSGLMALGKIDADDVAASKFRDQLPTTLRSQVEIAARQINSTTENEVARFQSYGTADKPIDVAEEIFVTQAQRRAEVIAEDQGYKAKILGQGIAVAQDTNVLGFIWVAYDGACVTCMGRAGQFYKLQQDGSYNVAELPGFVHPGCRCRMNIVLSSGESVLL